MFTEMRKRRAAKRVQPGDGRPLKRFRWWQLPGRALFHLPSPREDGCQATYTVDVRHWQNQGSSEVKAHLYVDGRLHAESRIPAAFPAPGGTIEVAMSGFGIKRCHFVAADGAERQLVPDPASLEGRRARLDRDHPVLSRLLGLGSLFMLVIGVGLVVMQIAEPISRIPPIASSVGIFESPVHLPLWLNIGLGVGAALGSMERALRLRYNWLLDSLAN